MKNNQVFMINRINYVLFTAVYSYKINKCCIKMLKHRHLTMLSVLVGIKEVVNSTLQRAFVYAL